MAKKGSGHPASPKGKLTVPAGGLGSKTPKNPKHQPTR